MAIQQAVKEKQEEAVIVDINDTGLAEGEMHEVNLKEDWQAKAAPPPAAKYGLKIFIDDDKVEQGQKQGYAASDPNGKYYKKQVVCKIQDATGVWQDSVVFYNVSSGVPKGKTLSSMAGLLGMMKVKLPAKISDLALTRLFIKAVKQIGENVILVAECDWSVWDKNSGKGDFGEALLVGMKNFPKKDGKPYHVVYNKKGEEFVAKLKIIKWLGKQGEVVGKPAVAAPTKPIVQAPKPVPPPVQELEELTIESPVSLGDDGEVVLDI